MNKKEKSKGGTMKIRTNFPIVALLVSLLFGYTVQASQHIAYSLKVAQQRIEEAGLNWRNKEPEVLNLGRINHVEGFVYDKESGDLILVGQDEEGRAPLTLDDLVVALRARFRNHEWPLVSIDPTEDTIQKVRFEGGIRETAFGQSLFDAGYQLEQMGMGLVEPGIPGLKTCWDRCIENLEKGTRQYQCNINSRFWFYPINPYVEVRDGVCVVRGLKVGVFTEVLSAKINGEEVKDLKGFKFEETDAFASDVSSRFNELCRVQPSFNRLRGLQELVSLSDALRELDERANLSWWLQKYPLSNVKTTNEVKVLERKYNNGRFEFRVSGEVHLTALAMRLSEGDVRALRDAVIKVRPSIKALSWRFMATVWIIPLTPGQVRPWDIAPLLQQAIWLFTQKRYTDSLELWDSILNKKYSPEILMMKADTLFELNRFQDAIATYDELDKRYGKSTEPGIQEIVASAMFKKGGAVGEVKGPAAAIATYDELDKRYGKSTEPGIREQVASAMVTKGLVVSEVKGLEAAIAIYDELEKRYGKSTEPEIQDQVAKAMYNKGVTVGEVKGPEAEIAIYDELEKRYGKSTEPGIQVKVATAMVNKGFAVGKVKGQVAEIAIYDELEKRYGKSTEPEIQEQVASAMFNKAGAVGEVKGQDAEIAIYDELEKRYGKSTEPEIQKVMATAVLKKGVVVGEVKGPEAAIAIYDGLEKRYGKSTEPEIQVQVAKAMLKKGVALFELRRYDEARKVFEKADKLGDPEARRALELMNRLGE